MRASVAGQRRGPRTQKRFQSLVRLRALVIDPVFTENRIHVCAFLGSGAGMSPASQPSLQLGGADLRRREQRARLTHGTTSANDG
jgi:hypothetical protein